MPKDQPWADGPYEILHHGLELLQKDTDSNRRIAMILVDNAVEQMIKTYLNLPKRVTGLTIPRARREEIAESFPKMLDALEEFASAKLVGIDISLIEWHHRQRNQLYHEGFGLTISRQNVDIYAALAISLFKNLFGLELIAPNDEPKAEVVDGLVELIDLWTKIEDLLTRSSIAKSSPTGRFSMVSSIQSLETAHILSRRDVEELHDLRQLRNEVVHGKADPKNAITRTSLDRLKHFVQILREEWEKSS